MPNKELWLMNLSQSDVNLGDLGLKVPIGRTVDLYKVNPYLEEHKVNASMKSGSLFKRLRGESPVLKVVKGSAKTRPHNLDLISQDDGTALYAKKVNSSVFIEAKPVDIEKDSGFEFADYGVDIGKDSHRMVDDTGAVFVKAADEKAEDAPAKSVETKPESLPGTISNQSAVVMKSLEGNLSHPAGDMADQTYVTGDKPFIVVNDSKNDLVSDTITPEKTSENNSVVIASKPLESSEDSVMESFDAKVATKSDDGVVVMQIKEHAKKTTKKKTKKKRKKKAKKSSK